MALPRFMLWMTSFIAVGLTAYWAGLALVLLGDWNGLPMVYAAVVSIAATT